MKTQSSLKRVFAVCAVVLFGAFVLVSCKKDDNNPQVDNSPYTVTGNANVAQVFPVISDSMFTGSSYTGGGTISGTYNPDSRLLSYTTNWNNLSGAPFTGGLYSGASGAAGTVVGEPWMFDSTATTTGSRSDTMTLSEQEGNQLIGGNWYYILGTSANPSGEVRGQISASR